MSIDRLQLLAAAYGAPGLDGPGAVSSSSTKHSRKPMKPLSLQVQVEPRISRSIVVLLGALLLAATLATAATPTLYWDINGSNPGAADDGNPPDGVWASNTTNWTTDYSGSISTFAYPGRANIVFAAAGDPVWYDTPPYTVTIDGVQQVSDIVFQDGSCTLTTASDYLDKDTPFISVLNPGQTATMNLVIVSAVGTANGITKFAQIGRAHV